MKHEPDWLESQYRHHFESAAAVRRILEAELTESPVPTTCIFGYRQKTPQRLRLKRERNGRLNVVGANHSHGGDGVVPESSAVPDRAEIHPVVQQNAALHADRDVQRQLRFDLVERPRLPA